MGSVAAGLCRNGRHECCRENQTTNTAGARAARIPDEDGCNMIPSKNSIPPNELRPRNKAAGAEANRKSGLRRVENAQSSAA
jgi:hypothetical protein